MRVEPGDGAWWEPDEAVVLAGAMAAKGPTSVTCCRFVNFFRSQGSAARYLRGHPALRGEILTLPEAIEAGRTVFGELLAGVR